MKIRWKWTPQYIRHQKCHTWSRKNNNLTKETSILTIRIIDINLAKNCFQLCALNQANKVLFNRKLSRKRLTEFMQQQEPSVVAMEARSSSNY